MQTSTFDYGFAQNAVPITVTQPVMMCLECGEEWTDYRGENARDEAVHRHLELSIKTITAERDALREQVRGLREALIKYAQHGDGCPAWDGEECTCGADAALASKGEG